MSTYRYFSPKCTLFGYGCLASLGEEIQNNGYKRALIVTDKSLIELGLVKKVTDVLDKASIPYNIFDGVKPNPTIRNVESGLAILKENNCDFLISIGGGSAHDCAKAICVVATSGGRVQDYRGINKSIKTPLPLVAINTTAGTASECTRAYVIVDEETNEKYGNRDNNVMAAIAVDDHELMMGLPRGLTAGTGMDALTHAVEAYTSKVGFCITSALGLSAIKLVFRHLENAALRPDETSREAMATAQYLAGLSFGNASCGLVHSMSHQLSAIYDLPHGLCNAIILPEVVKFNCSDKKAEKQYAELAEDLFPLGCADKDIAQKAGLFIEKIIELSGKIGTRVPLSTLGVKEEDISLLADKTLKDGSLPNNPVQPTKEEVEQLFRNLL